jgi:prepilin-type N-terminal cleavage/methylation domain-containing protein
MQMRNLRNRKGFTLIELMIVVVIIGILAAIAIPKFNQASARAKEKEADGILKQIYTLQNTYFAEHGAYATSYGSPGLTQVGWEDPSASLKHYALPAIGPLTGGITMLKAAGQTGFCDRAIDVNGALTSTGCP